jgi:butyryl-CoA dehydrogenase
LQELNTTTNHLLTISSKGDSEKFLSDATLYMELFGYVNLAWQWLKQATVAERKLKQKDKSSIDENFYRSKMKTMQFFFHYELVKTRGLHLRLRDGKLLTLWKEQEVLI